MCQRNDVDPFVFKFEDHEKLDIFGLGALARSHINSNGCAASPVSMATHREGDKYDKHLLPQSFETYSLHLKNLQLEIAATKEEILQREESQRLRSSANATCGKRNRSESGGIAATIASEQKKMRPPDLAERESPAGKSVNFAAITGSDKSSAAKREAQSQMSQLRLLALRKLALRKRQQHSVARDPTQQEPPPLVDDAVRPAPTRSDSDDAKKVPSSKHSNTLGIFGVCHEISPADVKALCQSCDDEPAMGLDRGRRKNNIYLRFSSIDAALSAKRVLAGTSIRGQRLNIGMVKPSSLPKVDAVFVNALVDPREDHREVIDLTSGDGGEGETSSDDQYAVDHVHMPRGEAALSVDTESSSSTPEVPGVTQVCKESGVANNILVYKRTSAEDHQFQHLKMIRDRVLVSVAAKKCEAAAPSLEAIDPRPLRYLCDFEDRLDQEQKQDKISFDASTCASELPVNNTESTSGEPAKRFRDARLNALRSAALEKRNICTTKISEDADVVYDSSIDRNFERGHGNWCGEFVDDALVHSSKIDDVTGGQVECFEDCVMQKVDDCDAISGSGLSGDVEEYDCDVAETTGNVVETASRSTTPPPDSLRVSLTCDGKPSVQHDKSTEILRLQAREHFLAHKIEIQRIRNEINRNEDLLAFQTSKLTKARQVHDNLCRVEREQFRLLCSLRKTKQQLLERSAKVSLSRIELMADVSSARLQHALVEKVTEKGLDGKAP